jgi:monoamine oxidase
MSVFDVAIIGAGAAGIAAARRLLAAGRRVVVLEARGRAGGRAVTDHSLGVPADLGAAWLHFATINAWTPLAEAAGFTIPRREPNWGPGAWIGDRAPTPAESAAAGAAYMRYHGLIDAAAAAGRDVALTEVLPQDHYRPRFDAVMTWAVGVESREVSTLDLQRYAESEHNWPVPAGLGTVVATIARELPIHCGAQVSAIDWGGEVVRIDSTLGRIEATAAIVTVPTSVLARGAIRFTPALPPGHEEAFANLPLGVCNKVFFRILGGRFAGGTARHFLGAAHTSRTCSWLANAADQPLLLAYFGGDLSRELEQRGELALFARDELKRLFGTAVLDELGAALSTAWGGDAHSLGSYSAAKPGHAHCREQLALPVSPRLHFAGEAASVHYYGTLHGAWLSGTAAAERLL